MSVTTTKAIPNTWGKDYAKIDSMQRAKEAEIDAKDIAPDQKRNMKAALGGIFDSMRTDFLVLTAGLPYDSLLQAEVERRFAHSCSEVDRRMGTLMREVEKSNTLEEERKASGKSLAERVSSIERPSRSHKAGGFVPSTFSEIRTLPPLEQIRHILAKDEKHWHTFADSRDPADGYLLRAKVTALVNAEIEAYKRQQRISPESLSGDEALLAAHRSSDKIHASMREFHNAFQDLAPERRGRVEVFEGGKGMVISDGNKLVVVGDGMAVVRTHSAARGGRVVIDGQGNIVSSGGRGNVISSKVTYNGSDNYY